VRRMRRGLRARGRRAAPVGDGGGMSVRTPDPRSPVRVALVGCGRISRNHLEAIERVEGLELAAVCDVVEERARTAGEGAGVPWYTSYEAMLAEAPCEAVAICTPSGLHPQHGSQAGARRQARHLREADGHLARGGRRARPGVRHLGGAPLRRQAEPPQPAHPAAQARGGPRALRPAVHGELHRALDAPAGVLRSGGLARDVGVRRRRVHEPGLPLRGPGAVAHGTRGERPSPRRPRSRAASRPRTRAPR
jgi:hypothetical protein